MIRALLQFARLCRAGGLRVSTAEVLAAVQCLAALDLADEDAFRAALRANFVKERKDRERFEKIYDLYFHTLRIGADSRQARSLSKRLIDLVAAGDGSETDSSASAAFLAFLAGDADHFLEELRKLLDLEIDIPEIPIAENASGSEAGESGSRLRNGAEVDVPSGADDTRRPLGDLLMERLGLAGRQAADGSMGRRQPLEARHKPYSPRSLGELPFTHLSRGEAREVYREIERLTRKLRDIVSRRRRRERKGAVDIRKTIRRSSRYEGLPLEIILRKRQKRKPKIVVLCDVSYSVWQVVPFMLNLLYSVQDCLTRVRSFVFIAQVTDVSETMKNYDLIEAIDRVMADFKLESPHNAVYGDAKDRDLTDADPEISDYGAALEQFNRSHADILDKKTTLIILGDGRTNFLDPRPDLLEALRVRCRRIVWLNPEAEELWEDGDSRISAYRPHCDEVRPCRNLNELSDFISGLIL